MMQRQETFGPAAIYRNNSTPNMAEKAGADGNDEDEGKERVQPDQIMEKTPERPDDVRSLLKPKEQNSNEANNR